MRKKTAIFGHELLTEQKDLLVFPAIAVWTQEMLQWLQKSDHQDDSAPLYDGRRWGKEVEFFVNQSTLMLYLLGGERACVSKLERVIAWYLRAYRRTQNQLFLDKLVQPSINLVRADRLSGNAGELRRRIREFGMQDTSKTACFGGMDISLVRLTSRTRRVWQCASRREVVKAWLYLEPEAPFPGIDHRDPTEFEAKLLGLTRTGHEEKAVNLLLANLNRFRGLSKAALIFRGAQLLTHLGEEKDAKKCLHTVIHAFKSISKPSMKQFALGVQLVLTGLEEAQPLQARLIALAEAAGDSFQLQSFLAKLCAKPYATDQSRQTYAELLKNSGYPSSQQKRPLPWPRELNDAFEELFSYKNDGELRGEICQTPNTHSSDFSFEFFRNEQQFREGSCSHHCQKHAAHFDARLDPDCSGLGNA